MRLFRLFRRRRARPKPVVFKREWQANPNFPGQNVAADARRRRLILDCEMAAVFGLIIYLSVFSPLFALTDIKVEASPALMAKGVSKAVDQFMSRSSLGLIPHANYLLLKPSMLIRSIENDMRDITAFEQITVAKHFPNELNIKLVERQARYLWRSQAGSFGLDDHGQIVSHFNDASANPEGLIVINDDNNIPVQVGARIIKDSTIKYLTDFILGIFEQNLTYDSISIPTITCPTPRVTEPVEEESDDRGDSTNLNSPLNSNSNPSIINTNDSAEVVECDRPSLILNGLDFIVNTTDGWQIRFLANQDTGSQLNKLKQFLQDSSRDPKSLSYIDLRFGERIYFK